MKLCIPRSELKQAVAGFTKIVNGRTTLPVLGCVRLENNGHGITAQVTDLDQHLKYHFSGSRAEGDGTCILPLANLKDLVHGNALEAIEFETGDKGCVTVTNHVGDHSVRHLVQGIDLDEWPFIPASSETKPAAGFMETYRRLVPFASTDQTRYLLRGVYVDVATTGEHPVTMVATDGQRLSLWNSMNLPLAMSAIVPTTKFLSWKDLQGDTEIGLRTQQVKKETRVMAIAFRIGPWLYEVKAIEGTYPGFRHVIPGRVEDANSITFADEDVVLLRKVLPTFPGHDAYLAAIVLRAGSDGKLLVTGRGRDDTAATPMELTGGSRYEGKLAAITVNRFFLLDALNAGFRVFRTADELSPLISSDGHPAALCHQQGREMIVISYEVLLGVDRAARDTGRRITMRVCENDPLSAGIKAEQIANRKLSHPDVMYTHAMTVTPLIQPVPAATMALAAAA